MIRPDRGVVGFLGSGGLLGVFWSFGPCKFGAGKSAIARQFVLLKSDFKRLKWLRGFKAAL